MVLKACSDDDIQSHSGEITAIYLLQKYRGIGLGKTLLKWGIEKFKAFGCTTVAIWVLRENPNIPSNAHHTMTAVINEKREIVQ